MELHPELPAWMAEAGPAGCKAVSGTTVVPARSAVVLVERR